MVKIQLPCAGTHRGYIETLGDQMSGRTVFPGTWASASGMGPCCNSRSLGKIFHQSAASWLLCSTNPRPQLPAALPFRHMLEPMYIFGNWSLGGAWRVWIRGGQAAKRLWRAGKSRELRAWPVVKNLEEEGLDRWRGQRWSSGAPDTTPCIGGPRDLRTQMQVSVYKKKKSYFHSSTQILAQQ